MKRMGLCHRRLVGPWSGASGNCFHELNRAYLRCEIINEPYYPVRMH
jgi:hypothetical protein